MELLNLISWSLDNGEEGCEGSSGSVTGCSTPFVAIVSVALDNSLVSLKVQCAVGRC